MNAGNGDSRERRGQCMCGAVKLTASQSSDAICACHCKMCRRWSGAPFMEIDCGDAVQIEGEEHVSVYDSSNWAERGFCARCGSHLFYRLKETRQHMVPVGLFDDDQQLTFRKQVFVDERPHYYRFANETRNLTAAETIAQYSDWE